MTPNNHDDISSDLGRALHERAEHVGAPLTLSGVTGKATSIRRRRAVAGVAAAAAAVAIIVPTAIAGSDVFDSTTDGNKQIATNNPTPNPTGDNSQSWPQALDVSDLELGEAPNVTWYDGTTLHTPDVDLDLPQKYSQVVKYDDGYLAMSYADGTVSRLGPDGAELDSTPTQSPIVTSSDGNFVLYVGSGTMLLHDNSSGEDTVIGSGHEHTDPIAVVDGVAYFDIETNKFPQDGHYWDGEEVDPTPGSRQPWNDVSDNGQTLLHTEITDFGSCSRLTGPVPGVETLGETCDFTLEKFSPDGEHLVGAPAYRDGFGDSSIAVLPADGASVEDGQVVFHYAWTGNQGTTFLDSVWEDDEHLIAITFTQEPDSAQGQWQIVRLGLDGSVENAVEPIPGTSDDYPFRLG